MIHCYPVWTAAAPIVRRVTHHISRRITRHGIRHAALATVRIVCVSVPAWLAVPSPAAAPDAPLVDVMPPPMLPWPGDEAPWGWGADDMGGNVPPAAIHRPMDQLQQGAPPLAGVDVRIAQSSDHYQSNFTTQSSPPISDAGHTNQPVPEPGGVAVLGFALVVLGWVRR